MRIADAEWVEPYIEEIDFDGEDPVVNSGINLPVVPFE